MNKSSTMTLQHNHVRAVGRRYFCLSLTVHFTLPFTSYLCMSPAQSSGKEFTVVASPQIHTGCPFILGVKKTSSSCSHYSVRWCNLMSIHDEWEWDGLPFATYDPLPYCVKFAMLLLQRLMPRINNNGRCV